MRTIFLAAASLSLASCATTATAPVTAPDAAGIEGDVRYLASDALAGRQTGTEGYQKASQYAADRFAALGVAPGGDNGTYFQAVPLRISNYGDEAKNTLTFSGPGAPTDWVKFEDYIPDSLGDEASGSIEAPLVFVGRGYVDARYGRDDFAGVDVKGKIAVVISGAPSFLGGEERAYFNGRASRELQARGAVGMISLQTEQSTKNFPFEELVGYYRHHPEATWLAADGTPYNERPGLRGYAAVNVDAARSLMAARQINFDEVVDKTNKADGAVPAFDMNMTARIGWDRTFKTVESRNVIGLIPGSDPKLRDEYVVMTAHLDHLGSMEADDSGDTIANGAMDNASGSAIMIDLARRLAINPPRRSVLVTLVTAEEMGLIGSSYNAQNPVVPADSVVANVNIDMPMLTYPISDVIAYGGERSTLFPVIEAATTRAGVALAQDPNPDEAFFVRSDHYSYIKEGVPSVYLDSGPGNGGQEALLSFIEAHYHQPSDEVDLIDYDQAARFADLGYEIAFGIANMDTRPVWKKGDFFGTAFDGPMAP
ncbi:M28 family metallopeptidase [Croceicoccus naphthovorans]|uniref:Uncharacterized protein n=1 Tax=Croceicoccus naphthovorans TaxID=1348774 RepID=A0A0G3XE62_9SPHN|nr:M28 family metallopeptidase [Croceicoccus naphthovorans]AKM09835.1 hypothetical protein AB433_07305 [Croceicoccus naphthovorans]MBB3991274.1 Zn-dependent M28 family amino/carboxypeptidase [Croceicoccus naphthovorans]